MDTNQPQRYSENGFWEKLAGWAKKAGKEVIHKALLLYYVACDSETPPWAKAVIYGALGYFILPIDAIPDVIPVVGFTDDAAALASCLITVGNCTKDSHRRAADDKCREWFG